MHRIADVFEQLARHQGFRIERHIADRAARAVKVADKGQPIHTARRARKHGCHPPHPQAHAQRPKGGAHALRLVMRALGVIAGVLIQQFRVSGSPRRCFHRCRASMTAHAIHGGSALWFWQIDRGDLGQRCLMGFVIADFAHLREAPVIRCKAASNWARVSRSNIVIHHF